MPVSSVFSDGSVPNLAASQLRNVVRLGRERQNAPFVLFGQLFKTGDRNRRSFIFQEEYRLFGEACQNFRHHFHTAAIQFDLRQFPLQVGGLGGKISAAVYDEADHGPFDRKEGGSESGRAMSGIWFCSGGDDGFLRYVTHHANCGDARLVQAVHDPVQAHLRVELAQVVGVD